MSESTEINYDREKALESQVESVAYSYEEDPSPAEMPTALSDNFSLTVFTTQKIPKLIIL